MDWSGAIGQAIVILTFCGLVMKPLNAAIKELRETIKDLRDDLRNNKEKREAMDRRLVAVEASAKSAHHRIDSLERR